jgi:hypothetical protein
MEKKLNKIINLLLLFIIAACKPCNKNEEQKQGDYIMKSTSIMSVNCDSISMWSSEKNSIPLKTVLHQIGVKDSLFLKASETDKEITIYENNKTYIILRTDILITEQKTTWVVYYTDELKELIFIEIKAEDPNSRIYLSNKLETKEVLCKLVTDSRFILNKLKS